jgi:MFS transporter, CP family, cyanate transporter
VSAPPGHLDPPAPARPHPALLTAAIVAIALNLRAGATSVGAVLPQLRATWGLSGTTAGLLTSLPVATFAAVGVLAPLLARWFTPEPVLAAAMLVAALGLLARTGAGTVGGFAVASVVALSGAAIGNVLLPSLVTRYFPTRVGAMTALYSTALALGMAGGAGMTVPAERVLDGGWRIGLGIWIDLAVLAALLWLAVCWGQVGTARTVAEIRRDARIPVHRAATARWLALFFGCQSLNAYIVVGWLPSMLADAGLDRETAAWSLAAASVLSIPMSLLVPWLTARRGGPHLPVLLTTACYAGGYLGLLGAPGHWPWLWAVLLGAGNGALSLAVTLIGLRSRHPRSTAALSAFVQGAGYLLAIAGPLLFGLLHQLGGSWRPPLLAALATLAVQLVAGLRAGAGRRVEDELGVAVPR